jgi:PAS domain S-box-containing protein
MSVRQKFILTLFLSAFIPAACLLSLDIADFRRELIHQKLDSLDAIVGLKKLQMEMIFDNIHKNLLVSAQRPRVINFFLFCKNKPGQIGSAEYQAILKNVNDALWPVLTHYRLFDIILADENGKKVYSLNPQHTRLGIGRPVDGMLLEEFRENGRAFHLGRIYRDPLRGNRLSLLASNPCFDDRHHFLGIVIFVIDVRPIYELIQNVTGLDQTGETLLVEKQGNDVVWLNPLRHDPQAALKRRETIGSPRGQPSQAAASGQTGRGIAIDYRGKKVLASWLPLKEYGWGLVTKIDAEEELHIVIVRIKRTIFLGFLLLLLIFSLATVLANTFTRPLLELVGVFNRVGKGDLSETPVLSGNDEISHLSMVFHDMVAQLHQTTVSKDQLDAERKRWKHVVQGIADEVWIADEQGRVSMINLPEITKMGLKEFREKTLNQVLEEVDILNPDGKPRPPEETPLLRSLRGETVRGEEIMRDRKTGKKRWRQLSSAPIQDEAGKIVGAVAVIRDVTALKEAEESRAQLSAIVESSEDAIISKDLNGNIATWNAAAERLLGYQPGEIIGKPITTLLPPERREEEAKILEYLRRGEKLEHIETVRVTKDGRRIDVSLTASPIKSSTGKIIGASKIFHDITARKKTEQALQESEQQFRALITARDAVFRMSADWHALRELTGQEFLVDTQFPTESWLEKYIPPHAQRPFMAAVQDTVNNNKMLFQLEHEVIRADGSLGWASSRAIPIIDDAGRITEWFGATTDITDRKRWERALVQSEFFYKQTLESVPGMVFTARAEGYCYYFSKPWTDFTGLSLSENTGLGWINAIHPEHRARVFEAWRTAVKGDAPYELEYPIRHHDGHSEWFRVIARPIRDANGKIERWLGIALNVNQLKEVEMALERSNKDLESFAYAAAHDLKSPLSNILMFSELLEKKYRPQLDEKAKEYLKTIHDSTRRMNLLITGLLDYSRLGRERKLFEPVNMDDVMGHAKENLKSNIEKEQAVIHIQPLPAVRADKILMIHLFQNLIGNAVKYHKPGVRPQIDIFAIDQPNEWHFAVRDNGIGIEEQYFEKIFEIFTRVQTGYEGTGIGLSTAKKIVRIHGGRISVESRVGQGSTFYVILPKR